MLVSFMCNVKIQLQTTTQHFIKKIRGRVHKKHSARGQIRILYFGAKIRPRWGRWRRAVQMKTKHILSKQQQFTQLKILGQFIKISVSLQSIIIIAEFPHHETFYFQNLYNSLFFIRTEMQHKAIFSAL